MYSISDEFKTAVAESHQMAAKVEVVDGGGNLLETLKVSEGFVRIDKTASVRRQLDVVVNSDTLVPKTASDLLHPLSGNEVIPYRGVILPSTGLPEYVPLGVFGPEDTNVQDSGEGVRIDFKGFDRSRVVQRNRWTQPYFIDQDTNVVTAVENIIRFKLSNVEFSSQSTSEVTPPLVYGYGGRGGDPWEAATKLAASIGFEVFFDGNGTCIIRPEPDLTDDPVVWEYSDQQAQMLLSVDRRLTREGVFNHVIVFGLNTTLDEPVRVDIYDDDPESPTYYLGPFGDVPTYLQSHEILTVSQAEAAGRAKLRQVLGVPEKLQFVSVVNPAHESGDIIEVDRSRAGIDNSRYIIDKLTIPLKHEQPLNIGCREKRTVTT